MTPEEIASILAEEPTEITFEEVAEEAASPLNQPVVEKDIGGHAGAREGTDQEPDPTDAPEQFSLPQSGPKAAPPLIPFDIALQAADAYLASANNFIEIGAGFFAKIKQHPEFVEFEEIVQVIDQQNRSNVRQIKLDEDDLTLLRPLLAQVIQKRAKGVTPESQLLTAVISILIKKVQVVAQIRAQNKALEQRILNIIRDQQAAPAPEAEDDPAPDSAPQEGSTRTPSDEASPTATQDTPTESDPT